MKRILFSFSVFLLLGLLLPSQALAQNCNYSSTQARIQTSSTDPWVQEITITQGQRFRVGSFHNQTGRFANDTLLTVFAPSGNSRVFSNGFYINPTSIGDYRLVVTTNDQDGAGCTEQAVIHVVADPGFGDPTPTPTPILIPTPVPTPTPNTCSYGSTQARVQSTINDSWQQSINVEVGQRFNVGSFHNTSGNFATDTQIFVTAPSGRRYGPYNNARRLRPGRVGNYIVEVITRNQSGPACTAKAFVQATSIPELSD